MAFSAVTVTNMWDLLVADACSAISYPTSNVYHFSGANSAFSFFFLFRCIVILINQHLCIEFLLNGILVHWALLNRILPNWTILNWILAHGTSIEWDIGPFIILQCDIWFDIDNICIGYLPIEHNVLHCILRWVVHAGTHFTQCT